MKRRLGGVVIIDGTDHELLLPNEHGHQETVVDQPLDTGAGTVALPIPHLKFGGEVRIEVQLNAEALPDGTVRVSGAAKLYEGISERTSDLDDEQRVVVAVPRGGAPVLHRVNLGKQKSDHAEILLCLTNAMAE